MNGGENLRHGAQSKSSNCPLSNWTIVEKFDRSEGKPPHRSTGKVDRIRRGNLFGRTVWKIRPLLVEFSTPFHKSAVLAVERRRGSYRRQTTPRATPTVAQATAAARPPPQMWLPSLRAGEGGAARASDERARSVGRGTGRGTRPLKRCSLSGFQHGRRRRRQACAAPNTDVADILRLLLDEQNESVKLTISLDDSIQNNNNNVTLTM